MKKRIIIISASAGLVLVMLSIVFGVIFGRREKREHGVLTTLYFLNEDRSSIEEAERVMSYATPDDLTKQIIEELKRADANRTINEKTKVNSIIRNADNTMIIDLSRDYITDNIDGNTLATYALIKSVCAAGSVIDVSGVKVTVDGSNILAGDGEAIDYLYAGDVNLHSDMAEISDSVIALYHLADENKLKRETYSVAVSGKLSTERFILERLAMKPDNEAYESAYINNDGFIGVETRGGICFVNLKNSFLQDNTGDDEKEQAVIYSMVNSLTELSDVDGVMFLIDGKRVRNFGSVDISGILTANTGIVVKN